MRDTENARMISSIKNLSCPQIIDWFIDCGLKRRFQLFSSHITAANSPICVFPILGSQAIYNIYETLGRLASETS